MKNLLGLDGNAGQTLHMRAYYTSGESNPVDVEVTTKMLGFHTENVNEPWVLEFVLDLVDELQTSIENWTGNYLSLLPAYR
ncbi:MAG: hypothetical protein LIP01_00050 [Tannerellaceae bacterium]|nr:hypothetical protein [Tannerellaceae bacterium]